MNPNENLKQKIVSNDYQSYLSFLYCKPISQSQKYAERLLYLINEFEKQFGQTKPVRLFSAPGRTEICGNHTDHQHGKVLAASVNLDMIAAAAPNFTNKIHLKSDGYEPILIDVLDHTVHEEEKNTTSSLIRGICAKFSALGYNIQGFDAVVQSEVLKGSGLSSSAAFEVLIGVIINCLFCEAKESNIKIAQIGQYAENVYFGKPSGLMDQMASSVGGFVEIDFLKPNQPIVKKIEYDFSSADHALVIINTGGSHADLTPDYTAVPTEMKRVASFFGKEVLAEVDPKLFYNNLPALRQKTGDRAILRAMHFFDDSDRVPMEVDRLKKADFESFKRLILESGQSSFQLLQNTFSCSNPEEQGVPLALALCKKFLGINGAYRIQGGGFAGTIQAFVPNNMLNPFRLNMEQVFGKDSCFILSIRPSGGIEMTEMGK